MGALQAHHVGNTEFDGTWVKFLSKVARDDLLDIITVAATSTELAQRGNVEPFVGLVERIFRETNAAV